MGMLVILGCWAIVNAGLWLYWYFHKWDDIAFLLARLSTIYNGLSLIGWAYIKAIVYLALFIC